MKKRFFQLLLLPFMTAVLVACSKDKDDEVIKEIENKPGVKAEAVDLGLSVKWASCNIGATSAEEYGDYFAWGETKNKTSYDWSSYKWCNGSNTTMTKYCKLGEYGTVDNKTTLNKEDDAAYVNWGGTWRMPTVEEQVELCKNCSWVWFTLNGVNGVKVTSKVNGNSIFLPAAGYFDDNGLCDVGICGSYWSKSLDSNSSDDAYYQYFLSDFVGRYYDNNRCVGQTIRPVRP